MTPQRKFTQQLVALPPLPGVYIMRDAEGEVIYVGKAARLRDRVRSYFGSPRSMEPKTRALREAVADFDFIVTNTEQEALHLEATLVKRHQPFFNVRLKDDKHYPYLKVDLADPWPRVYITRRVEKDGARYFGPYARASSVRKTLDIVNKLFPWRSCTKVITGNDPRPCLDFYIHRCLGPCASLCSKEDYDQVIQQVVMFLEGRTDDVVRDLRLRMEEAANRLDFERAAQIRDQVQAVERVSERQVTASTRPADEDVFGLARAGEDATVQVLFIRGTRMVDSDHFNLDGARDEADGEVMASFLRQFYEASTYVPREIIVPFALPDQELLESWLSARRGGRVRVLAPQRGEKRRLVEMAAVNARESLEMDRVRWLADAGKRREALEDLADELDLPSPPRRIECYDISNIQGTSSVGSMVVFVDGHPRPKEYRRFRIRTVEGANDFASMAEVLQRRFGRAARDGAAAAGNGSGAAGNGDRDESFAAMPDLVIVDGGRGQLNAALDSLRDMGLKDLPVAGLAKQHEELFVKDMTDPVVLPRTSQALYLVQRVRDEAHRFAITYHRGVHKKTAMVSVLDTIPGIGPKRKKALLRKFGSVRGIRQAETDEIAATLGFTRALAERVKAQL